MATTSVTPEPGETPELVEPQKWIQALVRELTENGKNAHSGLYHGLHSFYSPSKTESPQPASYYYIPDSVTNLIANELLTKSMSKRLFRDDSLRVNFSSTNDGPTLSTQRYKLLVIAIFSFKNYEHFLLKTLKLMPDITDTDLPLQFNPAPADDSEYAKFFEVFFWNQFLSFGPSSSSSSPRFLEKLCEKLRRKQNEESEKNVPWGAAGTVYRLENPVVDLGFDDDDEEDNGEEEEREAWAYVKRNYPLKSLAIKQFRSEKGFNRERLFWYDIDSCHSLKVPFSHPHILRPLLFWRCSHDLSFALMPAAECDLAKFIESATQREKARRGSFEEGYGGFRWLVGQLKGLVEGVEGVHNPAAGGYLREGDVKVGYHWDLKMENILVTFPQHGRDTSETCDASGASKIKGPILQLTDFGTSGIATFCAHQSPDTTDIPNGHLIPKGNTDYKPPEAFIGQEQNCGRDYDVWSLGGIMLEVLVWFFHGFGVKPEEDNTAKAASPGTGDNDASPAVEEVPGTETTPLTLSQFKTTRQNEKVALKEGTSHSGMITATFFYHSPTDPGGATFMLVPSVERVKNEILDTAINEFQTTMEGRSQSVRGLARLLDEITEGMLVVDRAKRLTAREVKRRMERVWGEVSGE